MKPEYQTKWGEGKGNCFQYALASILELNPEEVPDFCNEYGDDWHEETVKWLNQFGLSTVSIEPLDKNLNEYWYKDCILLVCVKNEDNVKHALIYKNGKILHDPSFWYEGKYEIHQVDLIFPMNPVDNIMKDKRVLG